MPPTFKKPLDYDPGLAQQTLQKSYQNSDAAVEARKRTLLAELGLADEEYELDDEEEEELGEGEEGPGEGDENDEEPILTRGHKHTNGTASKAALPSYGYRDLFGKEMEGRRRQMIEVKGYDQYLQDLLNRSGEQLQALRSEKGLMYPGNVEVIPELQHELRKLQEENRNLRNSGARSTDGEASSRGSSELAQQVSSLQQQLAVRDARLREAEAEAARLKARLAQAADGPSPRGAAAAAPLEELRAVEALLAESQAALQAKERELTALRASKAAASAGGAADAVKELTRQRDDAVQAQELLQQQLIHARNDLSTAEANFRAQQAAMAAATESEQAKALQQQMWALTEQHSKKVEELEAELKQKQVMIQQLQATKSDALQAMKEMKGRMAAVKSDAAAAYKTQLMAIQAKLDEIHALREGVLEELVNFQSEIFSEKTITQMSRLVRDKEISRVRSAQSDLRTKLAEMDQALRDARDETETVRQQSEQVAKIRELEAQGQIMHFREKWRTEFDKRRKLHNVVLELKGNIRVLCRVRPMLDKERGGLDAAAAAASMPVRCPTEETVRVAAVDNKAEKEFEFDRVLSPEEGQDKLYDEVAALVVSVLDGYNVAIMAYGQTGSGKTFTMEGPEGNPGVNLRALGDLFRLAEERAAEYAFSFSASVLEIYNEQIYDLLMNGAQDGDKLDVKQGPDGMYVPGLKLEEVKDMGEVTAMIGRGKANRSTYATNMNEHSSRSHLVLSVYITAVSKQNGTTLKGKLHLIDLAGSERLSRTGAQGDRLKEAQAINKSLSALGDVIQALQQRNAHIPYRNSKLTRLLEDSLGGNSKCVMIVNVSPAAENVSETKCSLEFASRARKVELGKARVNVVSADGGNGNGVSPSPSRGPASGRATPSSEGSMSRVASREQMTTSTGRRTPGPSGLSR
ncbi:hypothetical protein CHLRE_03g145107v5 [Chlamydomonas reinhardtii]|uniref:Kinesin-like protein n=1 Tax=Chlamydomonas reinhardtii TaxID=3055 RepID=A0A2K3DV85_CHLRE|nr:uncharacterized protein CHLRE_03g145107v5 [Chlamydomonas reinhardtii]PNW84448.1 hypothetical protein CHLRE_03g145107v5 [Chlamydomonas reinhardtii]